MAKITSKASLNVGTELTVDETTKKITLNATGNLVAKDGVTWQALYSKLVDLWATSTYQDSPFPVYAIDALSGQFQIGTDGATYSGWTFFNDATRQMLRDGGWSEYNSAGVLARQYAGIVGLGTVSSGAQLYWQKTASGAPTNFTFTDQCNEGIQVYGDAAADVSTTTFNDRTFFKGFVRVYQKKYKDSVLADTGKSATGAYLVNLLLSNEDDLKIIANNDGTDMTASSPYSGVTVSYYTANQTRSIAGANRNFKIIINNSLGATLEQIYTKVQYLLRQNSDINTGGTAGTITGKTAAALLNFVGDSLETTTSVFIDNVLSADSNRVVFKDDGGVNRTNPYTAAGTINFNAPLVGAGSSYRLMFTAPPGAGNDYGEAGAVTVQNASAADITGAISSAQIAFTFDYDNDTLGGTAGTDKAVTLVGIRPGSGKFVAATGLLTRSKTIALSLVAEQDRVYA
jgi:hypothetical protein